TTWREAVDFSDLIPQIGFANQYNRIGVLNNRANLPMPEQRRGRQSDGANSKDRKECRNEVRTIQQSDKDAVTWLHTMLPKRARNLHNFVSKLRIRDYGVCKIDRGNRAAAKLKVGIHQLVTGVEGIRVREVRQIVDLLRPEFLRWIREHLR